MQHWNLQKSRYLCHDMHVLMLCASFICLIAQLHAGMNQAAARNFHTATVYYRVLQSIAPQLTVEIKGKLQYAACRTRMCSHLLENFVHEHFEGRVCSDVYDIIGDGGRLGEGSYGSVYMCKHKKSGDMYACKVLLDGTPA